MFRRRSTDEDESLAEAFRRLDGVSTASSPVAASSLAEAARVDAALRGLLQPVAAPNTLAGRVAGEVGRARVLRWRRGSVAARRPVWAMAFAGAVVVVLVVGSAMTTMPGGGTIGERARGVGAWVRAVLGVGVRGDEADGEAYYWVPGMGILPLRPDAVVATGPVTATVRGDEVVIEGLVADSRGTLLIARSDSTFDGSGWMFFRDTPQRNQTRMHGCQVWLGTAHPTHCTFGPLRPEEIRRGVARLGIPGSKAGSPKYFGSPPSAFNWAEWRSGALQPEDIQFLQSLEVAEVPLTSVAGGALKRAHPLGAEQVRGGIRMQAWAVEPSPGRIAVRLEPLDLPPSDALWFIPESGRTDRESLSQDILYELSSIRLTLSATAIRRPTEGFAHAPSIMDNALPHGHALRVRSDISESHVLPSLPLTVVYDVPAGTSAAGGHLALGAMLHAVDAERRLEDVPLKGPNSMTLRVDTRAAATTAEEGESLIRRGDAPGLYPVTTRLDLAHVDLPLGVTVSVDRSSASAAGQEPESIRTPWLMLHWQDPGLHGRQLVALSAGFVTRTSLSSGLATTCSPGINGSSSGSRGAPETGPAPAMWVQVGVHADPIPSSLTLCLSRPIFQIPGSWTFPLNQP